eukprot:TRINITY_DN9773_c0_g1_i1.p1 TRINITY_DN9773_c0_g1~~TRINITY_DN9773_c0_g1_i1.p1  ORF type:complete len:319 (+),score=38.53 TRINITY_DN9773_c0_g1_i1:102-959(+)
MSHYRFPTVHPDGIRDNGQRIHTPYEMFAAHTGVEPTVMLFLQGEDTRVSEPPLATPSSHRTPSRTTPPHTPPSRQSVSFSASKLSSVPNVEFTPKSRRTNQIISDTPTHSTKKRAHQPSSHTKPKRPSVGYVSEPEESDEDNGGRRADHRRDDYDDDDDDTNRHEDGDREEDHEVDAQTSKGRSRDSSSSRSTTLSWDSDKDEDGGQENSDYATEPLTPSRKRWSKREEDHLRAAVVKYGQHWSTIEGDNSFQFGARTPMQLKDKWRNMVKKDPRLAHLHTNER